MKKYAMITDEGTAASETGLCNSCKLLHGVDVVKKPSDCPSCKLVDVSDNPEIKCIICGRK